MRFKHRVAELSKDLDGVSAHIVVVLDNEDTLFAPHAVRLGGLIFFIDFVGLYDFAADRF